MSYRSEQGEIRVVGIDLAKSRFHVYGVDGTGRRVVSRKMSRAQLRAYALELGPCVVGMEACGSAHWWGRYFEAQGHRVRLMAPQFVKPYVKSQKNDAADAEAICEAAQRPNMRFVALKSPAQQDIQAVHRMRSLAVAQRTAQVNEVRGLLLEYGIEVPQGRGALYRRLPEILEDAENGLSDLFRGELSRLGEALKCQDARIAHYDRQIEAFARADAGARLLQGIPGVGALGATALVAAIGDVRQFKNGRQLAAWLGLVPRQHSSGGREVLLGISKRGDVYLRTLLIHGARSVLRFAERKDDPTSRWAASVKARRHGNIASVALANKMARIAYGMLKHGEPYRADLAARGTFV